MARISTYNIDQNVVAEDKWIGTDSNGAITKNFRAQGIADFLNNTSAIAIAGQNNFFFQTDLSIGRSDGTISFTNGGGVNTAFNVLTTIKVSKYASSGNIILDYIQTLIGQAVFIAQTDNVNNFGIYKLLSLTQDVSEPNFYNASFQLIQAHGQLLVNKFYAFSVYPGFISGPFTPSGSVGPGTVNRIPKFNTTTSVNDSIVEDNGTSIVINRASGFTSAYTLDINGTIFCDYGTRDVINVPSAININMPYYNLPGGVPDASIININGKGPLSNGTMTGYLVSVSGPDNAGFFADLNSNSGTSKGMMLNSHLLHTGEFIVGRKANGGGGWTNVFSIGHLGDVVAETFSINSGLAEINSLGNFVGNSFQFNSLSTIFDGSTTLQTWMMPDQSGTVALTSDIPVITGFVPYTGATQDVNLGEFGVQLGNIEFDTTPTNVPTGAGSLAWNDSDGTLDLKLKGGNVTLQIGQEQVLRVVNKTATNVNLLEANYQAVRVTGAQGQRLKVDLAIATNNALSAETVGLVTETINNNQEGFITTSGLVRGINTTGSLQGETWVDGDVLYLSPTIAGGLTKVKHVAPNHLITMGYVVNAHITQGSIFVKVDNGYELDELHNVSATTPSLGDTIMWNSATSVWENKSISSILGYTPANGDTFLYDKFMTNQYMYFLPRDGSTLYDTLRAGGTLTTSGTGTVTSLSENPMGVLYTTASATSSTVQLYGNTFGGSILGTNFQFEIIRKFRINTTNGAQRFFTGISSLYSTTAPTNIEPTSQLNSIGVCKLQGSNNLFFMWNDATGIASNLDLGINFPGNSTAYTYKLRIYKTYGVASITMELTRILNADSSTLTVVNIITSDYNTGAAYYPVIWMGNNTAASGAVSFKDYGCIMTKRNVISA